MFYPPKDITPLNLDLQALPVGNGSANFDAVTTDGRPVCFRFDDGHLTVRISRKGGTSNYSEMENELFSRQIAFPWAHDLYSEQLCAFLGLTVKGYKVEHPKEISYVWGADLSGNTLYWHDSYRTKLSDDMRLFVEKITKAYPDIFFYEYNKIPVPVKIFSEDKRNFIMAFGCSENLFKEFIEHKNEDILPFQIKIWRKLESRENLRYCSESLKNYQKEIDFSIIDNDTYVIHAKFHTDNEQANEFMKSIKNMIDDHFSSGLDAYNIETGGKLANDLANNIAIEKAGYSKALAKACEESEKNYLFITARKIPPIPSGQETFIGFRPKN